jgi:hypothetical protein
VARLFLSRGVLGLKPNAPREEKENTKDRGVTTYNLGNIQTKNFHVEIKIGNEKFCVYL